MAASFMFPVNHQVVFLFTAKTSFKRKQELRDLVVSHGATVSYIITKKTSIVIAESADIDRDNYKIKQALKFGIPIVSLQFLDDCVQKKRYLDPSRYLAVAPDKTDEKFDKGQIKAPLRPNNIVSGTKIITRPDAIPAYKPEDNNCPQFLEPILVKAVLFQKTEDDIKLYHVLELHKSAGEIGKYKYRISTQSAKNKHGSVVVSETQHRFTKDADSALSVYSFLYTKYNNGGFCPVQQVPAGIIRELGSKLFQEWFQQNMYSTSIDDQVAQVVETMWLEAVGAIEEKISTPIPHLKLSEVEKAETDLRCLKEALKNKKSKSEIEAIKQEYYKHLPHDEQFKLELNTVREICREQDLCQVIKDVIAISESTDWSSKVSSLSKYNALHCYIQRLSEDDKDFVDISSMIHDSHKSLKELKIHNIFRVCRQMEQKTFQELHNKQLMFHGSKLHNYVGLLSRGLLLPQTVVEEFGVGRSDPGMLGYAVYFSDSAHTSLKYTSRSNVRGSTFLLVNEVALGDVYHTKKRMMDLKAPPEGFNSVHGVKCSSAENTEFEDDEYAIYDINQQCLRYLVELSLPEEDIYNVPVLPPESDEMNEDKMEEPNEIDIADIKDVVSPLSKVDVGLCGDGNKKIPLKSVHIRAKLVDLAAEVVVLQEYFNDNTNAIEAKYVFPLDDNAAVCGFEAFINGKHIIGTVKEKEEAHREYKEAISKGHGAYLMDEEKADVFTVRVGNLPPKASVLIKITYVAELQVNSELIDFYLPGSVASWDKHLALSEVIQTEVKAVDITKGDVLTTVQVSMEMPFDIRTITSPTHKIKMKKTATKAVVELPKNASLGRHGFRLQISLSHIHVPRMWVEKHPDSDSQACMLTFYPEFDAEVIPDPEIIFLIDCSNSMKGEGMVYARKLVLLALEMLPKMCRFNIISFGTTYRELFQRTELVTGKTLKEAKNFVMSLTATQGNTNVWAPVEMLALLPSERHIHNIYILSDGHLNHLDGLLKLISNYRAVNRIFTLTVGTASDLYTMKTIARIGGGSSQHYDPSLKSKWQHMLEDQLMKAAQPSLSAVQVEWQQLDDNCKAPVQAPRALMSLYNGQREVIYGFVEHCTMAVLKAEINGNEVSTLVSTHELNITTGKILHTLTARAIIRDWQNGLLAPDKIQHELIKLSKKSDIINLSKQYSVVTPFTSFVAVEERKKDETLQKGPRMEELVSKENVDILDYMDWQIQVDEEMPVDQKIEKLLEKAALAESYSVPEATRLYEEVEKILPDLAKVDRNVIALQEKVHQSLYEFYDKISKDMSKANTYANLLMVATRRKIMTSSFFGLRNVLEQEHPKKKSVLSVRRVYDPEVQYSNSYACRKPETRKPVKTQDITVPLTESTAAKHEVAEAADSVSITPKSCLVKTKKKVHPADSVDSDQPAEVQLQSDFMVPNEGAPFMEPLLSQAETSPHMSPTEHSKPAQAPLVPSCQSQMQQQRPPSAVSFAANKALFGAEQPTVKEALFCDEALPMGFSASKLEIRSQSGFKAGSQFGVGPSHEGNAAFFGEKQSILFGATSQPEGAGQAVEIAQQMAPEECLQRTEARGMVQARSNLKVLAKAAPPVQKPASLQQVGEAAKPCLSLQQTASELQTTPSRARTAPTVTFHMGAQPQLAHPTHAALTLASHTAPPEKTKPLPLQQQTPKPPSPLTSKPPPHATKPLPPESTKPQLPQATKPPPPPPSPLTGKPPPQSTKPLLPPPPPPRSLTGKPPPQSTKPLHQITKPPPIPFLPQANKPPPGSRGGQDTPEPQQQQQSLRSSLDQVVHSRGVQQIYPGMFTVADAVEQSSFSYDENSVESCLSFGFDLFGDISEEQKPKRFSEVTKRSRERQAISSSSSECEDLYEELMDFDDTVSVEAAEKVERVCEDICVNEDEEALEEEDGMNIISLALSHLEKLKVILKERYIQLQQPIFNVHLNKLETNMNEALVAISEIKNKVAKYSEPAPPENVWISVMHTGRTAGRESGVDSLFKLKQDVFWCPSDKLETLIGVDFDRCKKMFVKAGLRSLGIKAEMEVMQYLATLFVVLTVLHLTSDISPETLTKYINMNLQITDIELDILEQSVRMTVYETGETILQCSIDADKQEALAHTVRWLTEQDRKYPALATMLELSATKVTIFLQMFQALFSVKEV